MDRFTYMLTDSFASCAADSMVAFCPAGTRMFKRSRVRLTQSFCHLGSRFFLTIGHSSFLID